MPAFLALLCLAPSLTLNAGAELVCPWLPGTSPQGYKQLFSEPSTTKTLRNCISPIPGRSGF